MKLLYKENEEFVNGRINTPYHTDEVIRYLCLNFSILNLFKKSPSAFLEILVVLLFLLFISTIMFMPVAVMLHECFYFVYQGYDSVKLLNIVLSLLAALVAKYYMGGYTQGIWRGVSRFFAIFRSPANLYSYLLEKGMITTGVVTHIEFRRDDKIIKYKLRRDEQRGKKIKDYISYSEEVIEVGDRIYVVHSEIINIVL